MYKFSEYCNNFYYKRGKGFLEGHASQSKIPLYLMKAAMGEEAWEHVEVSEQALISWLTRDQKPSPEIWESVRKKFSEDRFTKFMVAALPDSSDELLGVCASRFGIEDVSIDKECFARALARQFYEFACSEGLAIENIVPKEYHDLINDSSSDEDEQSVNQSVPDHSGGEAECFETDAELLYRRSIYRKITTLGILFIVFIGFLIVKAVYNKSVEKDIQRNIHRYISSAQSPSESLFSADTLYDLSNVYLDIDKDAYKQYAIASALCYTSAINEEMSSEDITKFANRGLVLCQNVLKVSRKGSFHYYMALILQSYFYRDLGYSSADEMWTNRIELVENYLDSFEPDLRKNEDATLVIYGYGAIFNYYGDKLNSDPSSGTEELLQKLVDYSQCFLKYHYDLMTDVGTRFPGIELDAIESYCMAVFDLVHRYPSKDKLGYIINMISETSQFMENSPFNEPHSFYNVALRRILGEALITWGGIVDLCGDEEASEETEDPMNYIWAGHNVYAELLEYRDIEDPLAEAYIFDCGHRLCRYNLLIEDDVEGLKYHMDYLVSLFEQSTLDSVEIKTAETYICMCCKYILDKFGYDSEIYGIGMKTLDQLIPIDNFDTLISEENITETKDYFINYQKPDVAAKEAG